VLFDIDVIKESERAVVDAVDLAEAIIGSVRDPFVILDADLGVQKASEAFYTAFKGTARHDSGRKLFDLDARPMGSCRRCESSCKPRCLRSRAFQDFAFTYVWKPHGVRNPRRSTPA